MSRRRAATNWAYNRLFLGPLQGVAAGLRHAPPIRPEARGLEVLSDLPYGADPAHRLDIYRPAGATGSLPALVYIHGGGFRFFDKTTHWAIAARFARQGYVVFNVNYRLAPAHRYPAAVQDVADAMSWIHERGADYGGLLDKLVLSGESAGGNLATGLAISTAWRREEPWARQIWDLDLRPRVLLPACGYLGVSNPERHAQTVPVPQWMQGRIHSVSDHYLPDHTPARPEHAYANPIRVLETATAPDRPFPPTFAFAGSRDPVRTDTTRLGEALSRLGVPVETRIYEGGGHTFHALMRTKLAQEAWADKLDFLARHIGA